MVLVLEENLRDVRTLSVGYIALDPLRIAYRGSPEDHDGQ